MSPFKLVRLDRKTYTVHDRETEKILAFVFKVREMHRMTTWGLWSNRDVSARLIDPNGRDEWTSRE